MAGRIKLSDWYTPCQTWVDGLVAVILADRAVEERSDSMTDIMVNVEMDVWAALRGKVNWEVALECSPLWHKYGYADAD